MLHEPLRAHLSVFEVGNIELDGVLLVASEVAALLFFGALVFEQIYRKFGRHAQIESEIGAGEAKYSVLEFVEPLKECRALCIIGNFTALVDLIRAHVPIEYYCFARGEPTLYEAPGFEAVGAVEHRGHKGVAVEKIAMFASDALADEFADEIVGIAGKIEGFGIHTLRAELFYQELGLSGLARAV